MKSNLASRVQGRNGRLMSTPPSKWWKSCAKMLLFTPPINIILPNSDRRIFGINLKRSLLYSQNIWSILNERAYMGLKVKAADQRIWLCLQIIICYGKHHISTAMHRAMDRRHWKRIYSKKTPYNRYLTGENNGNQ